MEVFYLVGYSFGGSIALELASRLEREDIKGRLVLVDASPAFLKKLAIEQIANIDEDLESMYLNGLVEFFMPRSRSDILKMIEVYSTFEEKIAALVELMKDVTSYSPTYLKHMIKTLFKRIEMILNVDLEALPKIKSPISLIRPKQASFLNIEEDYDMKGKTENDFTLEFIDGTHITMLENEQLATLINLWKPTLNDKNI
jgi:fatty acid synthase